jgi:hypothetical protein
MCRLGGGSFVGLVSYSYVIRDHLNGSRQCALARSYNFVQ